MKGSEGYGLILAVIAFTLFLDGLDGTIVNVALPQISASFAIDSGLSSWVITAYFLTLSGLVLVFGKLCDSGALKRIVVWGLVMFSLSSLACGLSFSIETLIAFRAVQGIGASMLAASSVMLCVKHLPPNMTAYGLSVGLVGYFVGAALGPMLGGVLSEMLSWHWIFFINVPVGLAVAALSHRVLPKDAGFDRSTFDYRGSAMLFVAIVGGLYALESVPSGGLTPYSTAALLLFLVAFPLFVLHERRTEVPVLRLGLFRDKGFSAVTFCYLVMNICYIGSLYLLPFFMTVELGYGTVESGMFLLVTALTTLALCLKAGRMADTRGNRPFAIAAGILLVATMGTFCLFGPDSPIWLIVIGYALLGAVWGIGGGPVGSRLVDNVPHGERGYASSLISFYAYFGSALGTAVFAGAFGFGSSSSGQSVTGLPPEVFMDGFTFTMAVALVLAVITAILSWAVKEDGARDEPDDGSS